MQCFTLDRGKFISAGAVFAGQSLLPSNSILLQRTPFTLPVDWSMFLAACHQLSQQVNCSYVIVDASWDPFRWSNHEITQRRQEIADIFAGSKILILSARAQHFFDDLAGCVYFPLFLMVNYPELEYRPRSGRIGCLNKRNAAHRLWLMHRLLDQQLIDSERDVFSVRFTCLRTDTYWDVDGWAGTAWFNQAQERWPKAMATHPDDWPNDYSISHPAWHTGISIITETEPGADTLISEKTGKGILSLSCFSIYMSDVGYQVLEALGFQPRFFPSHAQDRDITPVIELCKTIDTEVLAMDYRQQHLQQIQHNFDWFQFGTMPFAQRPWFRLFGPKLQRAFDCL